MWRVTKGCNKCQFISQMVFFIVPGIDNFIHVVKNIQRDILIVGYQYSQL